MMTLDRLLSRIMYEDILDSVDLEYVVESLNIRENIIVKEKQDSYSYTFTVKLNNLDDVLIDDGTVSIFDPETNETVYIIPSPVVYETSIVFAELSDSYYILTKTGNNEYSLTVTVDSEWMNEEDRAFPVTVDPAIYVYTDSDLYEMGMELNEVPETGSTLKVSNVERMYCAVPADLILESAYVIDAYISYCTESGNRGHIGSYLVTESWRGESEYTSGNKITSFFQISNNLLDYQEFVESDPPNYIRYTWNITEAVKLWSERTPNYDICLWSVPDILYYYKSTFFTNSSAIDDMYPKFVVNYRDMNGLESYWSYIAQNARLAGMGYVNNATGNLVLGVDFSVQIGFSDLL